MENLEELRKTVSEQIGENFNHISRAILKRRLMDKLAETTKFDVPPTLASREFESLWAQIEEAKRSNTLEDEDKGKSDEALKKEYTEIAERRVRLGLMLSDLAKKNKVEVSREDLRNAMFQEAQRYPGQEKAVIEFFSKNAQAREALTAPILEEKVVDFIISKVQVKEKKVSRDELQKAAKE
jgi:trigger factor